MKSLINTPKEHTQEIMFSHTKFTNTATDPFEVERETGKTNLNIFTATAPEKWCLLQEGDGTKIVMLQV